MESPKQDIETLRNELNKHNHNYYVLSTPTISDGEFDKKMRELSDLELQYPEFDDPNSPSKRVGSDINKAFKQVEHIYPMLSLSNTYTQAEVQEFYNKVKKDLNDEFEIVCELKYDGTSISLTYQDGQLRQAITRGDGVRGDDVTDNVRTIRTIPLTLHGDDYPAQFEIRGEILMPWKVFEKLNVERAEREEQLFANPRNAASGTLKQQDSKVVAARKLDAYFYFLLGENLPIDGHYENLQKAQEWGFKISDATRKCKTVDEIFAFLAYWDIERKNLPVATDGVVLKVNSLRQQLNLGSTAKSPRWAIAYKFQTEREATKLLAVSYQVGRTGAITPVAQLEPVQLSGTKVQRASLYNADAIEALDLHIGDKVYVEKGGEIIPKIVDVDKAVRDLWSEKVVFVKTCPECGQPLQRVEGEAAYYCLNESACPPQVKGRIEHFLARRAMDIAGGGPETVEALFSANFIHNIADLYDLQWEQLATLERWAETSAKKLVDGIHESQNVPYARVLFALGIRHVGETVAKKLATAFPDIDLLMNATLEQLTAVDEIGERIALSLIAYFENPKNKEIINRLREAGLQFALTQDAMALRTSKLEGKTIVISGTFEKHSRDEYKNMIDLNGGKNSGSISAKTSFLLAGDNMGPAKLEKAEKLGIEILNEDDFLKLLN